MGFVGLLLLLAAFAAWVLSGYATRGNNRKSFRVLLFLLFLFLFATLGFAVLMMVEQIARHVGNTQCQKQ